MRIPSGVTDQYIYFVAVDATDFTTRETGLATFTVYRSRNGGVAAAMTTPTINETDATNMPGVYELLLDEDMTIDAGDDSQEMAFHITHAGMAPVTRTIELYRPKITAGETLTASGGVGSANVTEWLGTAAATPSVAGVPEVDVTHFGGTAGTFASGIPESSLTTSAINSVADQVWDEAASGHVSAGSFGSAMPIIRSGTAQAGASTTITLDASASAVDDFYNNQKLAIVSGTGVGQGRIVTDYDGTTKVATVSTWATNPDATSVFVITPFGSIPGATAPTAAEVADAVWDEARADHVSDGTFGQEGQVIRSGTAQAGTTSSITLDASASATNDLYNYNVVQILSGTGAGQSRQITDYVGTSKVATVDPAFTTAPDNTSVFIVRPLGIDAATVASIADAVWDEARSGHASAGTFGEYVLADVTRVSGDATAADNAESFFDGTGYAGTNNVIPSVTTVTGNVNGSVGSVTGLTASDVGAIKTKTDFLPSATAGAAGGVFIAGTNAATSITTALTADITGSLSGSVGSVTGNVGGSVASVTGAVGSVTGGVGGNVTGSVGSLAAQAKADVNAEVVDALATDTYAEPGQGTPAATLSLAAKVNYIFKAWRNRSTQTATQYSLYNDDAVTVDQKATVSSDGTTLSRGEIGTGP